MTRLEDVLSLMMPNINRASKWAYHKYGVDECDVRQEIFLKFITRLQRVDLSKVTNPKTYFHYFIKTGVYSAVRFHLKWRNMDDEEKVPEYSSTHESDIVLISDISSNLTGVTKLQLQTLVELYAKDRTMEEAGKSMGKSKQAISLSHKGAINRIRKNMGVSV